MSANRRSFDLLRIGKGLITLRRQRKISQPALARKSGVSQNTISNMERGESYELVNLLSEMER